MKTDLMNIIFGMKVRKARTEMKLSLGQFAELCELSPSYLTEIEKGRKYPKREKIFKISQATGIDYDELVSIRLGPSLNYLETALQSPFLSQFPFEEFGIDLGELVEALTQAPTKASALFHALFQIGQRYDMKEEHFLRAVLRSHQELNDNYFPEIEQVAEEAIQKYQLLRPIHFDQLRMVMEEQYHYQLDQGKLSEHPHLYTYRSILVKQKPPQLLLNARLTDAQRTFLLAREMGYGMMGLKKRSLTSPPDELTSFEQVLNDFKASYFAGALLMPRSALLADFGRFFAQETWQPDLLATLLPRYNASPEMLLYRASELLPEHFGVDLHCLRFFGEENRYYLAHQLNMNQLPLPNGFAVREHFCRRWLSVGLLRELPANPSADSLHVGIQYSHYYGRPDQFLCIGFARPLRLRTPHTTSVILGFRVNSELARTIHFLDDPAIPHTIINDTCERCPLSAEQCTLRAVPHRFYDAEQAQRDRTRALQDLLAELR